MRRLRDETCPQGRSSGTIHDTSAHTRSEFNARCHYKSARKAGRGERKKNGEESRRERSRKTILLIVSDAASRCLVSRKKNYGPRERSQIVEIIRCDSSPVLSLASPVISSPDVSQLPRSVLGREIMRAFVRNSADTRHGSVACLISQGHGRREISELSTCLIKTARVWIPPGRFVAPL